MTESQDTPKIKRKRQRRFVRLEVAPGCVLTLISRSPMPERLQLDWNGETLLSLDRDGILLFGKIKEA